MGFWLFMLAMVLPVPLTMIGIGSWFLRSGGPKRINGAVGYRTAMSMKNPDTWAFAHAHCGRLWWRVGAVALPLSAVAMLFVLGKDVDTVGYFGTAVNIAQIILMLCSVIPTERALRKHFDKDGNRKQTGVSA